MISRKRIAPEDGHDSDGGSDQGPLKKLRGTVLETLVVEKKCQVNRRTPREQQALLQYKPTSLWLACAMYCFQIHSTHRPFSYAVFVSF